MIHSRRLLVCSVGLCGVCSSVALAGLEPYEQEIRGFVSSSDIAGVGENDLVSLVFLIDPGAEPFKVDDSVGLGGPGGGDEEGSESLFAGATLVSLTAGSFSYTADTALPQQVVDQTGSFDTDRYFTQWEGVSGPAPAGLVPDLLTLSLEGPSGILSSSSNLPSPGEFAELAAAEGLGALRFANADGSPIDGIIPSIIFLPTGVPAPGGVALFGMFGLGAVRRRR